jgi:hypothetical protein
MLKDSTTPPADSLRPSVRTWGIPVPHGFLHPPRAGRKHPVPGSLATSAAVSGPAIHPTDRVGAEERRISAEELRLLE